MSLLIGTASPREVQFIRDGGWNVGTLTAVEFRRFFLRDPGEVPPGLSITFVALNHTMGEILTSLGGHNDEPPALRIVGRTWIDRLDDDNEKGA